MEGYDIVHRLRLVSDKSPVTVVDADWASNTKHTCDMVDNNDNTVVQYTMR